MANNNNKNPFKSFDKRCLGGTKDAGTPGRAHQHGNACTPLCSFSILKASGHRSWGHDTALVLGHFRSQLHRRITRTETASGGSQPGSLCGCGQPTVTALFTHGVLALPPRTGTGRRTRATRARSRPLSCWWRNSPQCPRPSRKPVIYSFPAKALTQLTEQNSGFEHGF